MRILFTTVGSPSHGRGQLPLARACAAAGHDVLVATTGSVAPVFANDDVRVAECIEDFSPGTFITPELVELAAHAESDAEKLQAMTRIMPLAMSGPMAETLVDAVLPVARSFEPDLILRDGMDLGSCLTAEHLGIPQLPTPSGASNMINPVDVLPGLNALRAERGLPTQDDPMSFMPHGRFDCVPADFSFARHLPPPFAYRQVTSVDRAAFLPRWIAELPAERPLVFASLGTAMPMIHRRSADFAGQDLPRIPMPDPVRVLGTIIEAMSELSDCSVVVVTVGLPIEVGSTPAHVHVTERVPQPLLLECADVFLTHGGFNSVREAMRTATPMVVAPQFGDQFTNAARVEQLGLGRELSEQTPEGIVRSVRAVLADTAVHARAREARLAMLALPEVDHLIPELEAVARA